MHLRILVFVLSTLLVIHPLVISICIAEEFAYNWSTTPLWILAQETGGNTETKENKPEWTFAEGLNAGKTAGKKDANKNAWFFGGLLFGPFAVVVAAASKPECSTPPPPNTSLDYETGYENGYTSARQKQNISHSVSGWIAITIAAGTYFLVIQRSQS